MSDFTRGDSGQEGPSVERREDPRALLSAEGDDLRSYLERAEATANSIAERFDRNDWVELIAAVLLAVATVATAWSAYQSTRWSGSQALATAAVHRARFQSMTQSQLHMAQFLSDVSTWQSHVNAARTGDHELADFWLDQARAEFKPALEAWATSVSEDEVPTLRPFDLPESDYAAETRALELRAEAEAHAGQAARANQTSDNYVLLTVMFALVLFFAGVGTKFKGRWIRRTMVSVATVTFIVGAMILAAMPQNVGL